MIYIGSIATPIRRKREKVCDLCKVVYTCSRKEHGRRPECNLGQMKLFFESIRSDPSEENSLSLNIDIQQFRNNMNNTNQVVSCLNISVKPDLT